MENQCSTQNSLFLLEALPQRSAFERSLLRRNIQVPSNCAFGCDMDENTTHLFVDCPHARACWFGCRLNCKIDSWVHGNFTGWLQSLIEAYSNGNSSTCSKDFVEFAIILCWSIYSLRNKAIFNNHKVTPQSMIALANKTFSEHEDYATNNNPIGTKTNKGLPIQAPQSMPHNFRSTTNLLISGRN